MNAAEFEPVEMVDTGVSGDVQAGDGVYTATVPIGANPEFLFYIRASNDQAMSLKPARAEYEYYIYDASATADVTAMSMLVPTEAWTIAPNPARETFRLVELPCAFTNLGKRRARPAHHGGDMEWTRQLTSLAGSVDCTWCPTEDGLTARLVVQ